MSDIETHGPAFPVSDLSKTQCPGMSLRDWFAAAAMQAVAMNAGFWRNWSVGEETTSIATMCYALADAMLAERAKAGEGEG